MIDAALQVKFRTDMPDMNNITYDCVKHCIELLRKKYEKSTKQKQKKKIFVHILLFKLIEKSPAVR